MLNENNLLKYFWAKPINSICYIMNRVLLRPLTKKTLSELWHDKKSNIDYFQFDCRCFILNNEDQPHKFNLKLMKAY